MIPYRSRRRFLVESAACAGALALGARASANAPRQSPKADELAGKAVAFLKDHQSADGSWSVDRKEPGLTALVVTALLRSRRVTPNEPVIVKGLAFLERYVGVGQDPTDVPHANYTTAIALLAFKEANAAGKYDALIQQGRAFLTKAQWDESEGKGPGDPFYGGAGYGGRNSRPDMSNTSVFLEALRDTGLPADDPAVKRALVFISRCQNLKSEFNDQPYAGKINDGGFIYSTNNGGESFAGKTDDGGLRSYAGMTYAGLKSMIYAGLTPDDPRVKAALSYIKEHYTLDENPGLGQQGLFYYYQVFAKALGQLGRPKITDAKGVEHDWRAELVEALARRQNPDGSWVNKADRFMEGDPNLVTGYGLLALAYAR